MPVTCLYIQYTHLPSAVTFKNYSTYAICAFCVIIMVCGPIINMRSSSSLVNPPDLNYSSSFLLSFIVCKCDIEIWDLYIFLIYRVPDSLLLPWHSLVTTFTLWFLWRLKTKNIEQTTKPKPKSLVLMIINHQLGVCVRTLCISDFAPMPFGQKPHLIRVFWSTQYTAGAP